MDCLGSQWLETPCSVRPAYRIRATIDGEAGTRMACANHLAAVICALDVECIVAFVDDDVDPAPA